MPALRRSTLGLSTSGVGLPIPLSDLLDPVGVATEGGDRCFPLRILNAASQ
jgi:hypothetical protein